MAVQTPVRNYDRDTLLQQFIAPCSLLHRDFDDGAFSIANFRDTIFLGGWIGGGDWDGLPNVSRERGVTTFNRGMARQRDKEKARRLHCQEQARRDAEWEERGRWARMEKAWEIAHWTNRIQFIGQSSMRGTGRPIDYLDAWNALEKSKQVLEKTLPPCGRWRRAPGKRNPAQRCSRRRRHRNRA